MSRTSKLTARIVNKHGTPDKWNSSVGFIPLKGEIVIYDPGYDSVEDKTYEVSRMKVGDGIHTIQELKFINKYSAMVAPTYRSVELLTHAGDASYTQASYTPPSMTHNVEDDTLTINFDAGSYTPATYTPGVHVSTALTYLENVEVSVVTDTK